MPNGGGVLPSYMQVLPPPGPAGRAGGSRRGKVPLPAFGPQVRHNTSSAPTHLLRCHRLSLATRTSASQQVGSSAESTLFVRIRLCFMITTATKDFLAYANCRACQRA